MISLGFNGCYTEGNGVGAGDGELLIPLYWEIRGEPRPFGTIYS